MPIKNFLTISFFLAISYWLLAIGCVSAQTLDQSLLNSLMSGFSGTKNTQSTPAVSINESDILLSWSANTYAPFNYKGKPLPVYGSVITASLAPAKSSVSGLDNLIYRWYLDDQFQAYASNSNRQTFSFRISRTNEARVLRVEILDKSGVSLFYIEKIIPVVPPEAIIFPAGKTDGRVETSISQSPELSPGQEQNFSAIPYFFSAAPAQLDFQWNFESQEISKTQQKNQFSVRVADGEPVKSFTKELSVLIINPLDEMQRAAGKIKIKIGN
jgi:hypothetical protein